METNNYYVSEQQVVLAQQRDAIKQIHHVLGKIFKMINPFKNQPEMTDKTKYQLESIDEVLAAVLIKMDKTVETIKEFERVDALIEPDYKEEIQKKNLNLEDHVGVVERDEDRNLHCESCLVPYNYCQDMVGKKVRLSLITLNCRAGTRKDYPFFANHVEVIE